MDKFNVLKKLGITEIGLKDAAKILGLIELAEDVQISKDKKTKTYSWNIASEITEFLLSKVDQTNINESTWEYIKEKLIFWVDHSLSWTNNDVEFNKDVLIKIPKSEFKKFCISKDDLIDLLNKSWLEKNSRYRYASLTDWQDEDRDILFFFNL